MANAFDKTQATLRHRRHIRTARAGHHGMSAFAVAIGGKADIAFCGAYVCFWPRTWAGGSGWQGDSERCVGECNLFRRKAV